MGNRAMRRAMERKRGKDNRIQAMKREIADTVERNIGFYLGDLPIAIHSSFDRNTGILKNRTMNNPAIFVPELKRIIYGCESWWREIESVEDFKGI